MFGLKRIIIKKNERGLLLRNGDFEHVLRPGEHWVGTWGASVRIETFAIEQTAFTHGLADYFMAKEPGVVAQEFVQAKLTDAQVGLRYENDLLVEILAPATRKLYWKGLNDVRIDVVDIAASEKLPAGLLVTLNQTQLRQRPVAGLAGVLLVQVSDYHVGLLTVDGKLQELLGAGTYGFWRYNRQVQVECVDLRSQALEISGQEILTKDKVGLRLNLSATWRYDDVQKAFATVAKPAEQVYRELQLGLRAAVGTRTLDELLEDKATIDAIVKDFAAQKLKDAGITLEGVGVKDIILPGEMKIILAQVVEAEKSAQANVIRRREETAATRSLLNTAKLMEGNPIALRMKELETLERVAERIDKISVFGGLDSVLNGLVKLR
ncbi:MAG: slipin family protein [Rhodoferax sp.]|nr:slipin family protein [Rhodoferax sp.]MBP7491437.1 slipin family protein [Rhodoferax sp.]